jgi:PKD repeat protein
MIVNPYGQTVPAKAEPVRRLPTRHEGGLRTRPLRLITATATLFVATILLLAASSPVSAAVLPDYNNITIGVANDAGPKYDAFGNGTYSVRFEGYDRGLNALHISTDPAVNFGQVTQTGSQSGTFYATDSGGKGYEDDILLLVAVNGTIPDDFRLHITADGYTWTPNPVRNVAPVTYAYAGTTLDEIFSKDDLVYGPQTWKPTGNGFSYPLFAGQDMMDGGNAFRMMFIDLNAGVLRPNASLQNRGAVRINYSFEHLGSFAALSVYGYCKNSNNGDDMIAWTNAVLEPKAMSGYSVTAPPAVLPIPGQSSPPTDPDRDGLYEDLSGNGAVGFTDVILFFKNIDWIAAHEPVSAFDFSGNGAIAFKDVQLLFQEV